MLLERARFIKRQTEQAISDVMAEGTTPSGTVSFGAPGSIAQLLFCPLARNYLQLYPRVKIAFYEGVSRLHSQLLSGDLDLAILPNTKGISTRHVELELIAEEPVYLVGPAGEFSEGATCTWQEVASLPLILSPDASSVRKWVEDNKPDGLYGPLGQVRPRASSFTSNWLGRGGLCRPAACGRSQ